jgi:hypothetical protein
VKKGRESMLFGREDLWGELEVLEEEECNMLL